MIFYTRQEVADMLKVTTATVDRWIRLGTRGRKLIACRAGSPRIEEGELMTFLGIDRAVDTPSKRVVVRSEPSQAELDNFRKKHGTRRNR